jgi:hypothetical protein
MSHVALKSGDLVQVLHSALLWGTPAGEGFSIVVVRNCKLGILICVKRYERKEIDLTEAMILDSKTGLYGWVDISFVKRID